MHLEEKTLKSETVYEGPIFTITHDTAELENGMTAVRDVLHHSGGVGIVALTDDNEIYLVKQFRYPFRTATLEIPAGKVNEGEEPYDCGKRELLEETGCTCTEYTDMGDMYPTPAYDTEITHMYMARGLSIHSQSLDEDEFLDVVKMPLSDAVQLVIEGKIPDGKTQIGILKAARILGI